MPKSPQLRYAGWARETTYGIGVAPTTFTPLKTTDWDPKVLRILDEGVRGVAAKDFNTYAGPRSSEVSLGGDFFVDQAATFLFNLYGTDTISGTGPYTHTGTLNNSPAKSWTVYMDYVANRRWITGFVPEDYELSWGTTETAPVQWTAKGKGLYGTTATQTAATISNVLPFIGTSTVVTIGGGASTRALSGKISWKRPVDLLWGAGSVQDPNAFQQGPLEVTGSVKFWMDDDTELAYILTMTKPTLQFAWTQGASTFTVLFTLADFETGKPDYGSNYITLDANFRAFYNSTDSGVGKITLVNSVAAAYV